MLREKVILAILLFIETSSKMDIDWLLIGNIFLSCVIMTKFYT